jgi:hypothetical protein
MAAVTDSPTERYLLLGFDPQKLTRFPDIRYKLSSHHFASMLSTSHIELSNIYSYNEDRFIDLELSWFSMVN